MRDFQNIRNLVECVKNNGVCFINDHTFKKAINPINEFETYDVKEKAYRFIVTEDLKFVLINKEIRVNGKITFKSYLKIYSDGSNSILELNMDESFNEEDHFDSLNIKEEEIVNDDFIDNLPINLSPLQDGENYNVNYNLTDSYINNKDLLGEK